MEKMKSILFLLLLYFAIYISYAVSANPLPITFTQPNGDTLTVLIKGDERISWYETMDEYTLLSNRDGYLTYAYLDENGDLQPSEIFATNIEERNSMVNSFLNSIEKRLFFSDIQIQLMLKVCQIEDEAYRDFENGQQLTGVLRKTLCALVQFPEKQMIKGINDFEPLMNQLGYSGTGIYGSVRDFFREVSYGNFDLEITLCGVYEAPESEAFYAGYGGHDNCGALASWCAQQVVSEPHIKLNDFDGAGSYVGFHFIFAGYGKESFGNSGPQIIWSHKSQFFPPVTQYGSNKSISVYSCSPELRGSNGSNLTGIGVICHEMGHALLALPDFYDTSSSGNFTGTGNWDLMASGSWNGNGSRPAHLNMYSKMKLGWVTPEILNSPTTITDMTNACENPVAYRINTNTSNEYFLLENRQRIKFDSSIPGSGLIVYRVHSQIANYINSNSVNASHPQRMYPVCAGASVAIPNSSPSSYGNINTGQCTFPGTKNNTSFTDEGIPSMKSWGNGNTNKPITNIKNVSGLVSFDFMKRYTITASADKNGTIEPSGNVFVHLDESQIFIIEPNKECEISDVIVDGASVGAVNKFEFVNVNKNHTIHAVFNKIGIDEQSEINQLSIIPNPARNLIELRIPITTELSEVRFIEIYNTLGQLVKHIPFHYEKRDIFLTQQISIADLSKGNYLLNVGNSTVKLVVQ